jgi:predicted glycoside hydrolase/deacetylase ChbG (UPF0249 family)
MKRIVLCADDYGQTPAISQAILTLIEQKRLCNTSCLVNTSHWPVAAKKLIHFHQQVNVGLHLNFTEGLSLSNIYQKKYGLTFFSLPHLITRAFLSTLDQQVLLAEAEAQIEHFVHHFGKLPNYLDGHHHIHQFPIIRNVVLTLYKKYFKEENIALRLASPDCQFLDIIFNLKKIIIRLSSFSFKDSLKKLHIPHNSSFSGIYNFKPSDYRKHFLYFLSQVREDGLIMCHPALSPQTNDSYEKARYLEYQYFISDQFLADLKEQKIVLRVF